MLSDFFMKCSKGQASFELILLVAFVMTLSIMIGGYFFQDAESASILATSKAVLIRELAKDSNFYYVNAIDFDVGNNNIIVCLSPGLPADSNYIADQIKNEAKVNGIVTMLGKKANFGSCN